MALKLMRPASQDAPGGPSLGWRAGLVVLLSVVAVLLLWGWSRGSDARTLARLPADERARLFQLTRDKAQALCADRNLEERCRAEVELLSQFPECDRECQSFVARNRPAASR